MATDLLSWLMVADATPMSRESIQQVVGALNRNSVTTPEALDGYAEADMTRLAAAEYLGPTLKAFALRAVRAATAAGDAKRRRLNASP